MSTVVITRPQPAVAGPAIRPTVWTRGHLAVLAGVGLVQALIRAEDPQGSDMLWGARFGDQVLRTGRVPSVDSWSWLAHGREFVANSWAWNIVLGVVHRLGGVIGFWVIGAVVSVGLALAFGSVARRVGVAPLPAIAVYGPLGLLAVNTLPRAQTVSNLAILLLPVLLTRLLDSGDAATLRRRLGGLFAFQLVWVNLHLAAIIGPALVLAGGLALAVGRRADGGAGRRARVTVIASSVSAIACLLTPYGLLGVTHSAEVRQASVGFVSEWDPAGFGSWPQAVALGAVFAVAPLSIRAWRRGRLATAATVAVLALATLSAIRFLPPLMLLVAPELADVIGRLRVRPVMWRRLAAVACLAVTIQAAVQWRDLRELGPVSSPGLVRALPAGCRLLNDDLVGDAVILQRPDVEVSLDGRNDMYGAALLTEVTRVFRGGAAARSWLDRRGVTCILAPSGMPLMQQLRHDPSWQVRGTDALRTLLVRRHRA